jgi:hypothetical protein
VRLSIAGVPSTRSQFTTRHVSAMPTGSRGKWSFTDCPARTPPPRVHLSGTDYPNKPAFTVKGYIVRSRKDGGPLACG